MLVAGSRLGAIQDVVLEERYEADPGPDDDPDPLRDGLANLLAGIDDYVYVIDPVTSPERADGSITNDLADVALALTHGLKHYQAGRKVEALWWWQLALCRPGVTERSHRCALCTRSCPICGWTRTKQSRPSSTRSILDPGTLCCAIGREDFDVPRFVIRARRRRDLDMPGVEPEDHPTIAELEAGAVASATAPRPPAQEWLSPASHVTEWSGDT